MKRSLEQAWREISTELDDVLDLEPSARQAWLAELERSDPGRAERVRSYIADLDRLESDDFLGQALPAVLAVNTSLVGRRLGAYTVDSAIGQGGMGTVWLAHRSDGRFEGDVAIKLLNAALLGGGGEDRFRREGHLLAKLEHPNIARLIDAGVSDTGQPLLVLEYVRGKPITEYCDSEHLDIRARIDLFLNVLAAVSHAHSRLVIHRDLKPPNIFVTADGVVKLLDFGIARLTTADGDAAKDLTRFGHAPLTLTYASPEQIRGVDIGTATDVYSLGVLLYELTTGQLPYRPKRETLGALEEEILTAQPALPSRVARNRKSQRALRGDLDTIIMTALRKDQSERYSTAAALAEDLRRHLRNEPILARSQSSWYRARKFLVRNKFPVLVASAVVFAMVAALGIALWQAHVAREHAAQAQEISHFIASVFEDADPSGSAAGDVRATDLLVRGRARVERELHNRAQLQTELLCTIGSSLYGLGASAEARTTFEKMVVVAGPSRSPLACLNSYADLLTNMGDYSGADAILRSAEQQEQAGAPSLIAGKTLLTRATLDLNLNREKLALEETRRGEEMVRANTAYGSRDSLESALQRARVEFVADDNSAALATAERAIAAQNPSSVELAESRGVLLSLRSLRARALSAVGRQDEAAAEYESLFPALTAAFGSNSNQLSVDLWEYSVIETHRGELHHAIALAQQALAANEASGGSPRGATSVSIGLGLDYVLARNAPAAFAWATKARTLHAKTYGTQNRDTSVRYEALAIFAAGLVGDAAAAAAQLQPLVDQQRAAGSAFLSRLLWYQGATYLHAAQFGDALRCLHESESLLLPHPDQGFQLPLVRADLGHALLRLGRDDEARIKLQDALSGVGVPHTATPAQADAHAGLALILLKRNDPGAALIQATAADDFWQAFDPANPAHLEATELRSRALRAVALRQEN
jgi:eukaryotic-like serine/threonine-protein kinase